MCGTDCGKRINFVLSGWFSSSSGLFHTRLFCCMFVSHKRGCLGACACVYIYWSNLHVYITRIYTRSRHVCGKMLHAEFTCVRACIYLYTRRVYMCVFTYMRTDFTCVGICLRICTQGLYMYVNILRIYTQSSHVRVNMIENIHIEFTYVCVYFGVCSHGVYMCVLHASVYTHKGTHRICMCMFIWLRIYTESLHVGVKISTYTPSVHTQCSHVCVYLFAFMDTEFKHTCGCVCIYV